VVEIDVEVEELVVDTVLDEEVEELELVVTDEEDDELVVSVVVGKGVVSLLVVVGCSLVVSLVVTGSGVGSLEVVVAVSLVGEGSAGDEVVCRSVVVGSAREVVSSAARRWISSVDQLGSKTALTFCWVAGSLCVASDI